ncbi:Endoglucanase 4 [Linum grandiflorum]
MGLLATSAAVIAMVMMAATVESAVRHDYGDALSKSILFFEGQRSGKLPSNQRMGWRKDSGLRDGFEINKSLKGSFPSPVDLVGGYYDAGDNVKFNFPMAFSTTMLAWSVIEFGKMMGPVEKQHTLEAIRWATDYFLKATAVPGVVFAQVGDPYADHNCWERPEDMDTSRATFAVSKEFPGSEVSGEIAAALAASAVAFRGVDRQYSAKLLSRASTVFRFAETYRGSYNSAIGKWVCPFYCDFGGYEDELVWAAAWLFKATKRENYWSYVVKNAGELDKMELKSVDGFTNSGGTFGEFGWDTKTAGINVLVARMLKPNNATDGSTAFATNADKFICSVLPKSPTVAVEYSLGGLLFKPGGSNMQHVTAVSFLFITYARHLQRYKRVVNCGHVAINHMRLLNFARDQVDYLLGTNPLKMSYMVGYGPKFPQKIHHRASSLPSIEKHRERIDCQGGTSYFMSQNPNPNQLTGAVVGGPDIKDAYEDSREDFVHSEPTTYINAPLVGVLGYFKSHPSIQSQSAFDNDDS